MFMLFIFSLILSEYSSEIITLNRCGSPYMTYIKNFNNKNFTYRNYVTSSASCLNFIEVYGLRKK